MQPNIKEYFKICEGILRSYVAAMIAVIRITKGDFKTVNTLLLAFYYHHTDDFTCFGW